MAAEEKNLELLELVEKAKKEALEVGGFLNRMPQMYVELVKWAIGEFPAKRREIIERAMFDIKKLREEISKLWDEFIDILASLKGYLNRPHESEEVEMLPSSFDIAKETSQNFVEAFKAIETLEKGLSLM